MSPAPDLSEENIILNTLPNTTVRNVISSSDELDYNLLTEPRIDLGLVNYFFSIFLFL